MTDREQLQALADRINALSDGQVRDLWELLDDGAVYRFEFLVDDMRDDGEGGEEFEDGDECGRGGSDE